VNDAEHNRADVVSLRLGFFYSSATEALVCLDPT